MLPRKLFTTIRHIIGHSLRRISDLLLYDCNTQSSETEDQSEESHVEDESQPKVRDRSSYNPMDHGSVPSALYGALTVLLQHGQGASLTVNQILEEVEATDSTLRKGLKIMEERGVIGHRGSPTELYIVNEEMALSHLQEFNDRGIPLFLKESGEANSGLH